MERDPLSVIDILFEGALDEDAWRRGLPIHTVRSQLKVIFGKTGVSSQAQSVRMVLTGPASVAGVDTATL